MTAETVPQNQAAPADVAKTNTADNNLVQMRRLLENERAEKERAIAENRRLEQERERFARGNKNEEEDEEILPRRVRMANQYDSFHVR